MAKIKSIKSDSEATVVAELTVSHLGNDEVILSFDKAWHRALELGPPTSISFNDFVRAD